MKSKRKPHSETWYVVHNSVRFAVNYDNWSGFDGIMISKTKKALKAYGRRPQRIVKVKITEL